jgi:hypothetical protein
MSAWPKLSRKTPSNARRINVRSYCFCSKQGQAIKLLQGRPARLIGLAMQSGLACAAHQARAALFIEP